MKRIDTHQHLWDLAQFPYSWTASAPALNRSFLLDEYLRAAEGTGIEKTIFVECDVDEPHLLAEAQSIQKLANANPLIAGIVAAARPEREDFPAQLTSLFALPKLRGIRRVLHVVPDEISQTELFAENLRLLAAHHLTFDLCVQARQLPLGFRLVEQCPQVQFILDHCGTPDVKARAFHPWREEIKRLAALPNVACKISGLVTYAGPEWTVEDLRPWIEHVVDCFGWQRIVWGGDWPVCTLGASLREWVNTADTLFANATSEQRNALFYQNAVRIYGLR